MEPKKNIFFFDFYHILPDKKNIQFSYKYKDSVFVESIFLPEPIPDSVNQNLLKKVLESVHLILGVSYYKMYPAKSMATPYNLTKNQVDFWNTVYRKGLGEFFYRNKIDFRGLINFSYKNDGQVIPIVETRKKRCLVGVGGGKDSIVAVELLKEKTKKITGLILETGAADIQKDVALVSAINYILIKRKLDEKIFSNDNLKGHVPFSAIFSFIALLVAVIYDYSDIVTANERSADFGNVKYLNEEINHQWSKSEEYEKLFQDYVKEFISPDIHYYSILRSYTEAEIVKNFIQHKKYFPFFSSCNRNFVIKNRSNKKWCGECAKCAFVFLILAVHLSKSELLSIFGKDLLDDKNLISLYKDLIGKGTMKPFDCVGTFEDSKEAFGEIKKKLDFQGDAVVEEIGKII